MGYLEVAMRVMEASRAPKTGKGSPPYERTKEVSPAVPVPPPANICDPSPGGDDAEIPPPPRGWLVVAKGGPPAAVATADPWPDAPTLDVPAEPGPGPQPYPWRIDLPGWPVPWREAWGRLANDHEDAGLSWWRAEQVAMAEVGGLMRGGSVPIGADVGTILAGTPIGGRPA
jgi:hypothetical protein